MRYGHRNYRAAVLIGVLVLAPTCRSNRPDDLRMLVPEIAPDVATHLMRDDPEELRRFARKVGRRVLVRATAQLRAAPPTETAAEFVHVEALLAPYMARLVDVMVSEFGFEEFHVIQSAYWRRSVPERMDAVLLWREYAAFNTAATGSAAVQAERIERLIQRSQPHADVINFSDLYGVYASLLGQLGRRDEIPVYLRRGIDAALGVHDYGMACQLLGALGNYYQQAGDVDTMRQCWDQALGLAREKRSWHEARILGFYGVFHRSRGQLAIARDLLLEAQDRCRDLGATEIELRFVIDGLKFFALLGCWDVVGRGLQRADMVLRESRAQLSPSDFELEETRLRVLRARHSANTGRCDEARELALAAADRVERWSLGPHRSARIRLDAARALSTCGLASVARPLLERGVRQCAADSILELSDAYGIELAQTSLALGDRARCREILSTVAPEPGSAESVRLAILELQLAIASTSDADAVRRLRLALQRLDVMAAALSGSPETDIAMAAHDDLRRLGQDLLGDRPAVAYAFEMRWRAPLGRGPRFFPDAPEAAFIAGLETEARQARAQLADHDAIHCIYDVRDDGIVRFTASGAGIDKQRLNADVADVRRRAQHVVGVLAKPWRDATAIDSTCVRDLRELARALLPEEMLRPGGPSLFLVTANDCLAQLPFEALNLSPNGYAALLGHLDVARLRSWGDGREAGGDSALVISSPDCSDKMRRRYSILSEALPVASAEAGDVRRLLPRSIALAGETATKANVTARWERARVVYFAGHLVRDPDVPYLTFLPMAATPSGHEDDSYLEVADVRGADLRRCRLAVLSSCGSGAPYANGWVGAPSLADAFIDAGAHAVVATAWAVRDSTAARAMHAFVRRYVDRGETDPIAALCEARREIAREMPDARAWAAYSITIGRLPAREASATVFAGESSVRLPATGRHR